MRQIKASEVKPGMVVRWESRGFTHEGTVERVTSGLSGYRTRFINSPFGMDVLSEATVTVLSEPQPEEPQEFGAKVVVAGERALRIAQGSWLTDGLERCTWDDLCEMGPVTIIDANPSWTAPADREPTPEVPDRIEEWPENDVPLRGDEWRDRHGRPWVYSWTHGRWYNFSSSAISKLVTDAPKFGPWTRVTDA